MPGARIGSAALACALVTLVSGLAGAAGAPRGGLYGVVTRGPVQPVCRAGEPCDAPAKVTLVFSRRGHVVGRVRSSATGRYRVSLAPATYAVRTAATGFERAVSPTLVRVPRGRYARIDFSIDTGIR